MHTLGPGIWQEALKNLENEKCTHQEMEYDEKPERGGKQEMHTVETGIWQETLKKWKMRNAHCRTWNMVRNLKISENEECTLQDLKYAEKQ